MAKFLKPPKKVSWGDRKSVFLAGTIDNGDSVDWQAQVESTLSDLNIIILNPRRDEWNPNWEQSIKHPELRQQVEWELEGLDHVSQIFMYFTGNSKSPITLLELGLHAQSDKLIIVCEKDYWRRGNIEVVSNKYNLPLFETLAEGLYLLRSRLA